MTSTTPDTSPSPAAPPAVQAAGAGLWIGAALAYLAYMTPNLLAASAKASGAGLIGAAIGHTFWPVFLSWLYLRRRKDATQRQKVKAFMFASLALFALVLAVIVTTP